MLRIYAMEFYQGSEIVGSRSLLSQSVSDAQTEAAYFFKDAIQYNPALTHAELLDISRGLCRDEIESVGTIKI